MSSQELQRQDVHFLHSILFKCTALVAGCTLAVVIMVEVRSHILSKQMMRKDLAEDAFALTDLLALQLGGAVKFQNTAAISEIADTAFSHAGDEVLGARVYDRDLSANYSSGTLQMDGDAVQSLAQEAMATGTPARAEVGTVIAIPVFFGEAGTVVGAVVSEWTDDRRVQALVEKQQIAALVLIAILLVGMPLIGLVLRARLTRPLDRLKETMDIIGQGDYQTEVRDLKRRDEIGQMAVQLDRFRSALGQAEEAARDTAFKSAAFVGSSAPMMMTDETFRITYVNPACEQLIGDAMSSLSEVWPAVAPDRIIGTCLTKLEGMQPLLERIAQTPLEADGRPRTAEKRVSKGQHILRLRINPALDEQRNLLGCVIEWADLTTTQRSTALVEAINDSQMRLEFAPDGRIVDANQNLLDLLNGTMKDTAVCRFARMFANNLENDPEGVEFARRVRSGDIRWGRFNMWSEFTQRSYVMEGSFALVNDVDGNNEGVIFLATDVTEQDAQMREAEATRAQNALEQSQVVEALGRALTSLSGGDLETRMNDEVPQAYEQLRSDFNNTVEALRDAIGTVIHNSDSIRGETSEITSAADDLSRRTEKQAATLEETAAALDELTASVRSAAEGADDASKMSADAQKNAEQGGEIAREAVEAMDGIKTSSQEISKITSVIDDIAFQTNLLALNAGVEAARAGEAGRGFAVVATEVRALAQRSSDAAREINGLISSSGEQVQQGVDLVDRTGTALASIVTSVSEISNRVSAIAGSAREQSSGLAEINAAVTELDHVTQQNAAMFEETTAASHALTAEADALATAVARFRMKEGAAPAPVSAIAPPPPPPVEPSVGGFDGNAAVAMATEAAPELDSGWEEF